MTTLVGTQTNFNDAVKELIELEYDALEAYEAAINRIENAQYKEKLNEFKGDHLRHIQELSDISRQHQIDVPTKANTVKSLLTQGKVVLGNLFGDEAILKAMLSNEKDTNTAYDRMEHRDDKWLDVRNILDRAFEDEKKHKKWLEEVTAASWV